MRFRVQACLVPRALELGFGVKGSGVQTHRRQDLKNGGAP